MTLARRILALGKQLAKAIDTDARIAERKAKRPTRFARRLAAAQRGGK
jgi:hypothetical protein